MIKISGHPGENPPHLPGRDRCWVVHRARMFGDFTHQIFDRLFELSNEQNDKRIIPIFLSMSILSFSTAGSLSTDSAI
jgi:hypothetical protein